MLVSLILLFIQETLEYSYKGEIKFYQNIENGIENEKSVRYFSKNGKLHLEELENQFFILSPIDNIYVMNDINVNLFFDRDFFPKNKEISRLLMPGYIWKQVAEIDEGNPDWDKEEVIVDGLDILSVSTSQESWEEKGVKTTYWLHKEYRLPLRRERVRKNKKDELTDVIEINIQKEDLDDGLFEPPIKNTDYSISQSAKSETDPFFIPQKILGAEKKKVLFLFEEMEESSKLKGVFSRYLSEEKDSYVYLIYFEEEIENKNFKIFKRALDLDLEGWSAVLPQTKEEWNVRILSNYPKPTLLKHLRVLWSGFNPPIQEDK